MAFGAVTALAVLGWSVRLDETLDPDHRRPLSVRPVLAGVRSVAGNRTALGYTLMRTFGLGAFLSFLGSTELIFDAVYGRPGWFVPYFSAFGVASAAVALGGTRRLYHLEAHQLALGTGAAFVAASAALFAVTVAGDGLPPFGVWMVLFSLANASCVGAFPTAASLALEPMGKMAGTAAAVMGACGSLGGSLLASFTDRAIDGSVMPIGVAYLAYSLLALVCQLWARGGSQQ